MDVRVGIWRKLSTEELMLLNRGVGENSWVSLGLQGDPISPSQRRSVLGVHWKDWCWSWNSNTLATSCKELARWKRPWCWEGLGSGREGDDREWDGWMTSPTLRTWVWVNSGSRWWIGRTGVLWFMGSQRVRHYWATDLIWCPCSSVSSVVHLCPTLCNTMDCSTPGFPVLQHFPEFAQTHVHQLSDAIQPSLPLLSPSPAFNLSQHQDSFQRVSSYHQIAKALELQFQHQSFGWIFRTDFL